MPVRVSSRKIHIESGSDRVHGPRGKMHRRARKLKRRAQEKVTHKYRMGRVNKQDHTTKVSYKPKVPKQEKATKSRLGLDHELKKIEDARTRAIDEYYEEMMEYIDYLEELNKKKHEDEDEQRQWSCKAPVKQTVLEIQDPRYIGEENYNELSWGAWEGDDDSWEEACREQEAMDTYDRQVEQDREREIMEEEEERRFQFQNGYNNY